MRRLTLFLIFLGGLTTPLWAQSKKKPTYLFEAAPLQGAMGQISLRGEHKTSAFYDTGVSFANAAKASERADFKDSSQKVTGDLVVYPLLSQLPGLFLTGGVGVEVAFIGRQRDRDYLTNVRYTENERYDLWVNKDYYLTLEESIGYRWLLGKYLTASLRFHYDQLLATQSEAVQKDIKSFQVDTESKGRAKTHSEVMFHVGVRFE